MSISTRVRANALRYVIAIALSAVLVEVTARAYFAVTVGWDVLLYGIVDSPHDILFDPKGDTLRWDERNANTAIHDNRFGNYSKYYPHQKRIHPDEFGATIGATINANGFRGKEFAREKKEGVTRIVTLGASSTFGFKTRDDQTYPYDLEEILNQRSEGASKYEVINLGIPHHRSDEIYSLFMGEAVPLAPDIVTLYAGYIDASTSPRDKGALAAVKHVPFVTATFRELRHRVLSVALIANKLFGRQYPPNDATLKGFEADAQERKTRFIESLDSIYQECQRRHILFIVASEQASSLAFDRSQIQGVTYEQETAMLREKLASTGVLELEKYFLIHSDLMDAERQWVKANNVPFVDVIAAMDSNRQYLIDWMHLNAEGNRIVAEALSDKIAEIKQ